MGASLSAGANSDYTIVAASALAPFNDPIMDLLAEVALEPSFTENEVALAKQNTKESLRQQRAQPSFLASEMVSRVMFGDHPYSVVAPTPESIDRSSRDEFVRFHRSKLVPNNAVSRLFMNLREDKGYTYGAYSNLDARRSAGTFRSTAEVRTPVTGDSLKEFFYELDRIRREPVSAKEIADAKSYLTGVFPIRLETQEGLTDQLVQIKMLNLPEDYLERYRDRVQAVTVEDIQRIAQKYVRPDEAALIVVGDGASVLEQMRPYCEDIEVYNTAGKRKTQDAAVEATDPAGSGSIEVETPLGQSIPATLTIPPT